MMDIKLHANARTTPAVRAEIQRSPLSAAKLARRFGVSETTVYKWRKAGRVAGGVMKARTIALTEIAAGLPVLKYGQLIGGGDVKYLYDKFDS